jgi:hypothetical protein
MRAQKTLVAITTIEAASGSRRRKQGGTWQVEANAPGKVIFDNFKAARP